MRSARFGPSVNALPPAVVTLRVGRREGLVMRGHDDDDADRADPPPAGRDHGIPPPPVPAFFELGPPASLCALSLCHGLGVGVVARRAPSGGTCLCVRCGPVGARGACRPLSCSTSCVTGRGICHRRHSVRQQRDSQQCESMPASLPAAFEHSRIHRAGGRATWARASS